MFRKRYDPFFIPPDEDPRIIDPHKPIPSELPTPRQQQLTNVLRNEALHKASRLGLKPATRYPMGLSGGPQPTRYPRSLRKRS